MGQKTDFEVDYEQRAEPKPFGFSGCFRLRNESQFMKQAIESHMFWLHEAVLIVQPSDDNTVELAYEMADDCKRIHVYEYPFVPDWIDTPGFYEKDPDQPGHLVHMSNWALSKCRYSWIVKVEGDVIALSTFDDVVQQIIACPDEHHYYGRLVLNIAGEDMDQVSLTVPTNGGWDECVVPNHPDYRFIRRSKWEVLVPPDGSPQTMMGLSGLHMKRCKEGKIGWNNETYTPFDENFLPTLSGSGTIMGHRINMIAKNLLEVDYTLRKLRRDS